MSGESELYSPLQDHDIITAMNSIPNQENGIENLNVSQLNLPKRENQHIPLQDTGFDYSNELEFSLIQSEPEDIDWVFVPHGEPNDSGFVQTPYQKQRSQSSSLDKTLSFVFTKQTLDYEKRKLESRYFPSGTGKAELSNPRGIVYEIETDRIFIADTGNNRIQVHSITSTVSAPTLMERTRSLSSMFIPEPKMNKPWGICTANGYLYVTQYGAHCVDVYTNNRNFVSRFGSKGYGNVNFSNPTGICADRGGIYVCDSNNNRVQVLKQYGKDLKYIKNFGIWKLKSPRDIKIHKSEIFVLDSGKQCMHVFTINLDYLRSFISNGERREADNPQFFDLDDKGNILLSDWLNHSIKVFDPEGIKIAVIASSPTIWSPLGIAIRMEDVFVVDANKEGHLSVF